MGEPAVRPPSTVKSCPVAKLASSEANHTAKVATSLGWPRPPYRMLGNGRAACFAGIICLGKGLLGHIGHYPAGADGVAADALTPVVNGDTAGEAVNESF